MLNRRKLAILVLWQTAVQRVNLSWHNSQLTVCALGQVCLGKYDAPRDENTRPAGVEMGVGTQDARARYLYERGRACTEANNDEKRPNMVKCLQKHFCSTSNSTASPRAHAVHFDGSHMVVPKPGK